MLLGAYVIFSNVSPFLKPLFYAPTVWIFLSFVFFFKNCLPQFRNYVVRNYVVFTLLLQYVQVVLHCTVHRGYIGKFYDFSLVDFFVSHHSLRQKITTNQWQWWHDTVQIDCTKRPYIPVKQARTVRAAAAGGGAAAVDVLVEVVLLFKRVCCCCCYCCYCYRTTLLDSSSYQLYRTVTPLLVKIKEGAVKWKGGELDWRCAFQSLLRCYCCYCCCSYRPSQSNGNIIQSIVRSNHMVSCLIPLLLLCFVVIYGVKKKRHRKIKTYLVYYRVVW